MNKMKMRPMFTPGDRRAEWYWVRSVYRYYNDRRYARRPTALEGRAELAERVRAAAVGGKVAVVESGMDCDCATYLHVSVLPAAPRAVERAMERCYAWAEGPVSVGVMAPAEAEARRAEFRGRDLALEAFEDGHPHVVFA